MAVFGSLAHNSISFLGKKQLFLNFTRPVKAEVSEQELVARILSGKADDFEVLVKRYSGVVYRLVYRLIGQEQEAQDITQETFIKAFQALASFNQELSFKPWLLKIALNTALSYQRRRKNKDNWQPLADELPAHQGNVSPTSIDVKQALSQLPLNYRQVAILRGVEELSFREIAAILGINDATARTWFKRAKEKLKKLLQGQDL